MTPISPSEEGLTEDEKWIECPSCGDTTGYSCYCYLYEDEDDE